MTDTLPHHTCTPYCDGQRYMLEEGVHVVDNRWAGQVLLPDVISSLEERGWEVLDARHNDDLPHRKECRLYMGGKIFVRTIEHDERHLFGWLVKVRKKQP